MCFIVRTFTIPFGDLDGPGARCAASSSPPRRACSCPRLWDRWPPARWHLLMCRVCAVLRAGPATASSLCRLAVKGAGPQTCNTVCHKKNPSSWGGDPPLGQLKALPRAKWGSHVHLHPERCLTASPHQRVSGLRSASLSPFHGRPA